MISVIGDFHIPRRANKIPEWEIDILKDSEIIAITGDLCEKEVLNEINKFGKKVYIVQGNIDRMDLPAREIFEYKGVKFGLVHGTEVYPRGDWDQLWEIAKDLDVQVLLNGHTHHWAVYEYKGIIFINPGSATGAWGGSSEGGPESMATLKVKNSILIVKVFNNAREIFNKTFKIEKDI